MQQVIEQAAGADECQGGTWASCARKVCDAIADARYAQAGVWRLTHVRVDLPMVWLAAVQAPGEPLQIWLRRQSLPYTLFGQAGNTLRITLSYQRY